MFTNQPNYHYSLLEPVAQITKEKDLHYFKKQHIQNCLTHEVHLVSLNHKIFIAEQELTELKSSIRDFLQAKVVSVQRRHQYLRELTIVNSGTSAMLKWLENAELQVEHDIDVKLAQQLQLTQKIAQLHDIRFELEASIRTLKDKIMNLTLPIDETKDRENEYAPPKLRY